MSTEVRGRAIPPPVRTPPAWAVLLGGLLLALAAWRWSAQRVERAANGAFGRQAQLVTAAVYGRMEEYAALLGSAAALFAASPAVGREQWARFVAELQVDTHYPGIEMLSVLERVAAADVARHVEAVRAEGFPDYAIHPAGARDEYFPVTYLEPLGPNREAFGYDLFAEPMRRAAGERARDSGQAAITGRIQLVKDRSEASRPAFVMFYPLYRDLPAAPTVAQRRIALRGFITAAFRVRTVLAGLLPHRHPGIDFAIYDGTVVEDGALLYDDGPGPGAVAHPPLFRRDLPLTVSGRSWLLRFNSTPQFEATLNRVEPLGFLLGILLVTGLLARILRTERRERDRARGLAEEMTAELREREARLSEAERVGRIGNWHWTLATNRVTWSRGNYELFGLDPQDFDPSHERVRERIHPDDHAAARDVVDRILRERRTLSWDFRVIRPDGEIRHLSSTGEVVPDATSGPAALFGTTVDITDRMRAEEAQRESEQRFRQLADAIDQVFWIVDLEPARVLYVSPAFETIWGVSRDAPYRDPGTVTASLHPDDRARVISAFLHWIAADGAKTFATEYRVVRPDGGVRCILDTRTVLLRAHGRVLRVGGISKDVTAEKAALETKATLESRLRQAEKMEAIGTLAGGIAHDFNNILGCILGFTELAEADAAGNLLVLESLANVLEAGQRAKGLVEQIVAFSRQQEAERHPLELGPVVRDAIKLVRGALPAHIDIRTHIAPELPPALADPTQICQLLMNLATNAAHAIGDRPGQLDIGLERVEVDDHLAAAGADLLPGAHLRLTVRDTGPGMDAATLEHIFEPFFTTKAPSEGTGLGLSVVHGIVRRHQGAIRVTSRPGDGSTFEIYLPVFEGEVEVPVELEVVPHGNAEHVLFVEDERLLAEVGRRALESLGYRVTVHTHPVTALEAFRAQPRAFDLVVTDLTMPAMSGIELAQEVLRARPGLPVLLSTGFGGRVAPESLRTLGVADFLIKPYTLETLGRAVHRALFPPADRATG